MNTRIISAISLSLLFLVARSQGPTLTFSNIAPVPGDIFTSFNADTTGVSPQNAGAGQNWNFSGLNVLTSQTVFTYVQPSSTPYFASFPSATVAFTTGNLYSYIKAGPLEYSIIGISSNMYTMNYTDPDVLYSFPFSFGNNFTDSLAGSYLLSGNNYVRKGTRTVTADGWGTLILPSGTYNNTLRVKCIQDFIDSSAMGVSHIYNTTYLWYDGINKTPMLNILKSTVTRNGTPVYGNFVAVSAGASGISEKPGLGPVVHLFPNPATDAIHVKLNKLSAFKMEIITLAGNIIFSKTSCSDNETTDISRYPEGIYFVRIISDGDASVVKFLKIQSASGN